MRWVYLPLASPANTKLNNEVGITHLQCHKMSSVNLLAPAPWYIEFRTTLSTAEPCGWPTASVINAHPGHKCGLLLLLALLLLCHFPFHFNRYYYYLFISSMSEHEWHIGWLSKYICISGEGVAEAAVGCGIIVVLWRKTDVRCDGGIIIDRTSCWKRYN